MFFCAGSQTSQVVCVEKEAGIVEEKFCNISIKPDDMHKPCNDHQCPARCVLCNCNIIIVLVIVITISLASAALFHFRGCP